ncbi:MAG: methionine adenosyltransferase [Candidatus Dadabacteria bacterium]|nr:methionine adenosyltransferase [Candidatus Dadabacteria bacterium]NIS08989.1 methionine adenosyltransferase [Candidatus Dadabacteria bacterium]NIV41032.1 methionine adenosyltransferase [Candidatus Dadabacteria bacterium]NIX15591.1 methionine adenosyltransferase [Candidatus Dadabacteria bacterium]NIY22332.1 methionine adenosyltransferase [Candidatus Dadabacteria bacterium]
MQNGIIVRPLEQLLPYEQEIEIVERKGIGHPDTICDLAAEQVSIALCRLYLSEFGKIMHHNVDKALLVGGSTNPEYKGGKVVRPMELIIAGRATMEKNGKSLPVEQATEEAIKRYLSKTIINLNIENSVKLNIKIRPGSSELTELFGRFGGEQIPFSNDTSIGTGFYPFDETEQVVYKIERFLNSHKIKKKSPFIGEDIKVMAVRQKDKISITLAVATVDKYINNLSDYIDKIKVIKELIKSQDWFKDSYDIHINTADSYDDESIYLTVTGTSAEHGDDGQVGRGNRANGLITPYRPMTLEAVAGKNPINHVGKLYNLFAADLCKAIVKNGYAKEAYLSLVSQIGRPLNEPQIVDIKVKEKEVDQVIIENTAKDMLAQMPGMWKNILEEMYEIA